VLAHVDPAVVAAGEQAAVIGPKPLDEPPGELVGSRRVLDVGIVDTDN